LEANQDRKEKDMVSEKETTLKFQKTKENGILVPIQKDLMDRHFDAQYAVLKITSELDARETRAGRTIEANMVTHPEKER
jgi:hypothetical protein